MSSKKRSIMTELQQVQDIIDHTHHRINVLEKKLTQKITLDNREALEIEETKKVLKKHEEQLLKLRKDNTQTFMIAACLIFAIFLIYGLYSTIFNINE